MITVLWDKGSEPIILNLFEVKKHFLNIVRGFFVPVDLFFSILDSGFWSY